MTKLSLESGDISGPRGVGVSFVKLRGVFHEQAHVTQVTLRSSKESGAFISCPCIHVHVCVLTLEALKQKAVAIVSDLSRSCSTNPLSSVRAR